MVEIYFQHCRFYLAQFLCNEDCCRSELLFPILVSRRLQSQSASAGCGGERGAALTAGGKQGLAASSCCAQPGPESQGVRAALPARCFQPWAGRVTSVPFTSRLGNAWDHPSSRRISCLWILPQDPLSGPLSCSASPRPITTFPCISRLSVLLASCLPRCALHTFTEWCVYNVGLILLSAAWNPSRCPVCLHQWFRCHAACRDFWRAGSLGTGRLVWT